MVQELAAKAFAAHADADDDAQPPPLEPAAAKTPKSNSLGSWLSCGSLYGPFERQNTARRLGVYARRFADTRQGEPQGREVGPATYLTYALPGLQNRSLSRTTSLRGCSYLQ